MKRPKCLSLPGFIFLVLFSHFTFSESLPDVNVLLKKLNETNSDTARIRLNLLVSKYHIFKPGENKADLDTAFRFLKNAEKLNRISKDKKLSGHICLIASYWYREKGKRVEGKNYIDQAIRILSSEKDLNLLGETYDELAQYYDYRRELDPKIAAVSKAASYFQQSGNIEKEAGCRQLLGDLYSVAYKVAESNKELNRALLLFRKMNKQELHGIYALMSRNYNTSEDFHKGYKYGIMAIKAADRVKDTTRQLYMVYNPVVEAAYRLEDTTQAIYYFNKMLGVAERLRDTSALIPIQLQFSHVLAYFGKHEEAIEKLKTIDRNYGKIIRMPHSFIKHLFYMHTYAEQGKRDLAKRYRDSINVGYQPEAALQYMRIDPNVLAYLTRYHIEMHEPELAGGYLRLFKKHADSTRNMRHLFTLHLNQFRLDTMNHNFESAVKNVLAYTAYEDSLNYEATLKQANFIKFEYENEIKEQNIRNLTNSSKLQQAELNHSNMVKNLAFGGAALLLVILVLLFNQYRIKQRTNAEITEKNRYQQKLIAEKDWLVKEIHHRVKNNLQTIMSLLESQSVNLRNDALLAIKDSQHRVQAMALIHQKLYLTDNLATINMPTYIRELTSYLFDMFHSGRQTQLSLDLAPIDLDVAQAIPIGLILNESITNSLKYAFPDDRSGRIEITLQRGTSASGVVLTIADNGVGIPESYMLGKVGSMGLVLINGLVGELGGTIRLTNDNGTSIRIEFDENDILGRSYDTKRELTTV